MANTVNMAAMAAQSPGLNKHPKGLYVLFATEMWERFSFYSMLALFTLYLQDPVEGFGWSAARATGLYANYLMFVYASPLLGGWLADKKLGYRNAVILGGFFFMAGHGLLSFRSMTAVYAALTCLVIGNGLFKPNVSTMVGNLYPDGSHLKDRAYNIFYMGINIGAFMAPVVMEIVKQRWGNHPAFAIAAFGMVISVAILWRFKKHVDAPNGSTVPGQHSHDAGSKARAGVMDAVSETRRVLALLLIFAIVIVFWMVFHQNGSTLTYWADDNTNWDVSGTISNAINPFWVVTLTFPLIWFWQFLDRRGKEPATPTKMAVGMTLTGLSFFILFFAARSGESMVPTDAMYASGSYRITERALSDFRTEGVPDDVVAKLAASEAVHEKYASEAEFLAAIQPVLGTEELQSHIGPIREHSYLFRVSAAWLIIAYAVVTLGELMLSPMGLSLVSKVAPLRMRGLLMGGWFVATAIGNKLTMIGIYWDKWLQSSFFGILGSCALIMAVVLFFLLKPLKRAMPGV